MELGTYFNLNMLNSMPIFICFVLEQKYTFMGKFGQKNQSLVYFQLWHMTFAKWNECRQGWWFKAINILKMSNTFVSHCKLREKFKTVYLIKYLSMQSWYFFTQ